MVRYIQLTSHDQASTITAPSKHTEILRLDETIREICVQKEYFDRVEITVDYDTGNLVHITLDTDDLEKYMERMYTELLAISMADKTEKQNNKELCE